MTTFDPPVTMRLVAGSIAVLEQHHRRSGASDNELRQFAQHAAMVCGWAPAGVGERLLAELDGAYPLLPGQRAVLPELQRLARQLLDAVAVLESDHASHDQRVAAAQTAVGQLSTGIVGSAYYPHGDQWFAAAAAMHDRARQLLRVQPAPVRQTLFDAWTATDGPHHPGRGSLGQLIGSLLAAGGVDGTAGLDRFGLFYHLSCGDWTGDLVKAEHAAGRPHPWALATWRRMQIEHWQTGTAATLWPVPSPGEPWADRAITEVEAMPGERRAAWHALLAHCVPDKDQARPSAAWRKQAGPLLAAVGAAEFADHVDGWLALVGAPRSRPAHVVVSYSGFRHAPGSPRMPDRYNVRLLSGLLWARALCPPTPDAVRHLGQIAERATRKISGHGPASPKLANAAVAALIDTDHPAAVAQLARLASRLTYKSTLRLVEKGLDACATALGIAREDVEEMALPGYGLPLADKLGDGTYEVEIHGTDAVVTWRNAGGKVVRAVPAQVRADHREELKELTATVKDIGATLIATRDRLDGLLRRDRQWTGEQWRDRFLDHPLARTLARRLIWTVDGVTCAWAADAVRTVDDAVFPVKDDAIVRLWHPAGEHPDAIGAWRDFLARHEITQPFKQAHREQYLLTDAERATGTYSNRFAAHVVLQHRLNALLARRGWSYQQWRDDAYSRESPRLALPDRGLRAELSIAGIDPRDDGVFDTMATDQLRFLGEDGTSVALEQVPAVVLSEVMRDVDLFVAVAGVGSDPNWFDGGPQGRYRDYWARTSFGELTPPGQTRREVLAALIPRLAIAGRCTLTDKFLEVRGDLHTYRIHYGSGNILIAPQDRYLCIIPASAKRAAEPDLFLPFEGDSRLSEIISKALLLAADQKIKDPIILRQL
ncbi:DUF4132 domain-containing protein [Actinoplanes palleronii]|uniref:DUF4132 domain-containing protein n=1 Tax=Actinoplanes palleronii TaxID=113570 RepID=A0ABQ4BPD2_9ACTN|nr:DUF4132 domain-containing protein [Actinoplanes palleronii]GIE72477.1 hypothetical protein Apa02nite_085850 [Actinoplanes palleronii]